MMVMETGTEGSSTMDGGYHHAKFLLKCCFTSTDRDHKDHQGRGAQDGHHECHTTPELYTKFERSDFSTTSQRKRKSRFLDLNILSTMNPIGSPQDEPRIQTSFTPLH